MIGGYYGWGKATQIYEVDEKTAQIGQRSAKITRTNSLGGAGLYEDVPVAPGSEISVSGYTKGSSAIVHLWFARPLSDEWTKVARLEVPPTTTWSEYRVDATVPADMTIMRLIIEAEGTTWFDDHYAGIVGSASAGPNLLANPSFEQDGSAKPPIDWWEDAVPIVDDLPYIARSRDLGMPYSNMVDMLERDYTPIRLRSSPDSYQCAFTPEATAWLLSLGERFQQYGGASAREKLYQLTMEMAPGCPQPYEALAGLYKEHNGYWRAAQLYREAARLSSGSPLEGKYLFEEGFLRVRNTGEGQRAVMALERATQLEGWDTGYWYRGAGWLFLGEALEMSGNLQAAIDAYAHVLECGACRYHREPARRRLDELSTD